MTYEDWITRIERLTNLKVDEPVVSAPGSVLLAPAEAELEEMDGRALFSAVTAYLLGPTGRRSAVAIRDRIDGLGGRELLPLLYAVRLIAARYGGTHRFWPPFREHLLNDSVKSHDIPNQIAPALTRAWLRLYKASRGMLYAPSEGPTHIKWPVAHAGLVYTDTNNPDDPLIRYGCELKSEDPTGMHELLLAEPQDFLQDLRAWISETPERARTHLAGRLLDNTIGPTIGELAQRRLRRMYSDLPCQEPVGNRSDVYERPSVRIVYDSKKQLLYLRVHPGSYRKRATGRLQIGSGTEPLVGRYDAVHSLQRFQEVSRPIDIGSWPQEIQIHLTDLDRVFHLRPPRNPFKGGNGGALLCDGDTGRQTRVWRPDTSYTLISTPDGAAYIHATGCLALSLVSGEEVDGFPGYLAYPAFSIRFAEQRSWDSEATQINQDLEALDAQFNIPPAVDVFAPRISPIAMIDHRVSGAPQFREQSLLFRLEPPEVEWSSVSVDQWVPDAVSFVADGHATPLRKEGVVYVGVSCQVGDEGRYRLSTGEVNLEFDFRQAIVPPSIGTARISLSTTGDHEQRDLEIARSPASESGLFVLGPPEAAIKLDARTPEKVLRRRIDLDTEGVGVVDVSSLDLPRGSAFLKASFLGRTSNIVTLIDGPYISPGSWDLSTDPPSFDAWIDDLADDVLVTLDIIGSRPWLGEIARHRAVTRYGRLTVSPLRLMSWEPAWLIVSLESGPPLLIRPWPESSAQSHFTVEDFGTSVATDWKALTERLARASLPFGLATVVNATRIAEFAADHPSIRQPEIWRPVESLDLMVSLAHRHIPLTAIMGDSIESGLAGVSRAAALVRSDNMWTLAFGSEQAGVHIVESENPGVFTFRRADGQPLAACGSCEALMPTTQAAQGHLGSGPNARCRSIHTSVPSAQGVVLYRGSAARLVHEVGVILLEGLEGAAGPPPADLRHLVMKIRESFNREAIPQAGRQQVLLDGLNLALEIIYMFEHDDRPMDVERIAEVAGRTTAAGEIAYAVLSDTNILEGIR